MSDQKESPVESIIELTSGLSDLNQHAVAVYEPIVNAILSSRSTDIGHIEHTLDGLLDFAGSEGGLRLFKTLCRYYWQIDQAATAFYINAYRDIWDSDSGDEVDTSNNPEKI
jgi:hypothetical protein